MITSSRSIATSSTKKSFICLTYTKSRRRSIGALVNSNNWIFARCGSETYRKSFCDLSAGAWITKPSVTCWCWDCIACSVLICLTSDDWKARIINRRSTYITTPTSDALFTGLTFYGTYHIRIRLFSYSICAFKITSRTANSRCFNIGTSRASITCPTIFRSSQETTGRSCIGSIFCYRKRGISICSTSCIATSSSDTFFANLTRRNICNRIIIDPSNSTIIW